jgi:hypothetical protein
MGWAEKRVQQYNQGQQATWIERRALEHANPVHLSLALIGLVLLIYGLWIHNWTWIIGGVILNFLGHLYCWLKK